jgi:uncharacterized protein involved in exopolysaccharide biosynthesis
VANTVISEMGRYAPVLGELRVCSGTLDIIGRRFGVERSEQVIGRSAQVDISIPDMSVSDRHAMVVARDGRHLVYDLGSSNGTYVNDVRILQAELNEGDYIRCGDTILEYRFEPAVTPDLDPATATAAFESNPALDDLLDHAFSEPPMPGNDNEPTLGGVPVDEFQHLVKSRPAIDPIDPELGRNTASESASNPGGDVGGGTGGPIHGVTYDYQPDVRSIALRASFGPEFGGLPPYPPPYGVGSVPPPPQYTVDPSTDLDRDDEDEGMSTKELLDQIRKLLLFFGPYWRSILALTLIGLVAGVVSYYQVPPASRAEFQITLVQDTVDNPVDRFERSNVQFFRSAQQNFRSMTLIEKTLKEMGIEGADLGMLTSIQGRLEFLPLTPTTFMGSFVDSDPEQAVRFLERHLQVYLAIEIEKTLKVIRAEADFLRSQLDTTETELKRTESELLVFKQENIDGLPEQARQYYDYLFQLKMQEREIERELSRLNTMVASDRQRLKTEAPLVDSRVLNTQPYQQAIVDVNRRIAEMKSRGFGEDHPEVVKLRAEAGELDRLARQAARGGATELEQRRNPAYTSLQDSLRRMEASYKSAHSDRARIAKDLEKVRGIVDKLPQLEAKYAELTRSYDATKSLHTRIFNQLKTTELQLELERASAAARYDIISPPHVGYSSPVKAVGKRAGMGGGAGLALGLLFAALHQLKEMLAPSPEQRDEARKRALTKTGARTPERTNRL